MSDVKKLLNGLEKKYVVNTFLSPVVMIGEVVMEVIIPFVMAKIIDVGVANKDLPFVLKTPHDIKICCSTYLFK